MVDPTSEPIALTPPDHERWQEQFRGERRRIREVLAAHGLDEQVRHVEHVGSTAVPELAAKDIVDLDVVVADEAVSEAAQLLEAELGGDRVEITETWQPLFREANGQRFNDHVFAASSEKWKVSVVTRDALRARPDLRRAYEELKRDLASEDPDLTTYSEGKSAFIGRILDVARTSEELTFGFAVPAEP